MALYDNPPQVDPATGRLPTYKQVLQQDPTTGVYKIKYEYTPIVSSSTAGQTLQTQLTTPVTTFPGISDSAGSGSDDDEVKIQVEIQALEEIKMAVKVEEIEVITIFKVVVLNKEMGLMYLDLEKLKQTFKKI
jgi:hypothetical protein